MGSPKSISLLKGNVQWPDPQDDPTLTPEQRMDLSAPDFLFRGDGTLYQNVLGLYVAIKDLDGKISTIKGLTGQGRILVASAHDMFASAVDTIADVVFNLKWDGTTYDPVKEIRLRQAAVELFNSLKFMSALWRSIQDGGQEEDSWPATVGNAIEELRRDNRIDRTWHVTPAQESELEPSRSPRALSPQARDRAQIARRDQGRPPSESGPPVLPGSNPMGIPMGRSSRFPGFDVGPRHPTGDTPFVAPKPKPFARGIRGPNPPMPGPDRRGDTGPNPAPQKKKGPGGSGGAPAPNPPRERSTDSKSASVEGRADPKPATETKTETPTASPATDQKAPPPTETTSGGGTTGGGTSTDSKDDKKSPKENNWAGPDHPLSGMPNPEDDGSGGTGGPRANPNPEDRFGAGDDGFERPSLGDRVFDPKLFRFRVPGALGDMPSDEGGAGSGGGIGGPRGYGGQNQNPNPEDAGGGGGGPRAYGSSSQSSLGGPRSYDAYPDPESTGGGGPRGRYNERPNPEDAVGPRGPSARNRSAIGPWSASRNRML